LDNHEGELFEAFAIPAKKQRYVELLTTKRGRDKVRVSLDHFDDLNPIFCKLVPASEQTAAGILSILKGLGAPSKCHLMSSASRLDGREMDLSEALAKVVGGGTGTFVSCIPGKLAYFEGEDPKRRYICHRNV
jgi:hypothetical protein